MPIKYKRDPWSKIHHPADEDKVMQAVQEKLQVSKSAIYHYLKQYRDAPGERIQFVNKGYLSF